MNRKVNCGQALSGNRKIKQKQLSALLQKKPLLVLLKDVLHYLKLHINFSLNNTLVSFCLASIYLREQEKVSVEINSVNNAYTVFAQSFQYCTIYLMVSKCLCLLSANT